MSTFAASQLRWTTFACKDVSSLDLGNNLRMIIPEGWLASRSSRTNEGERRLVEAAGVELRRTSHHQQFGRNRLAQAGQNRSNRRIEVHNRYTSSVGSTRFA